nr:ATP-binding cassette domain-containing protein [Kibdelosporangium sp. MJ126-NF4]CEL23142.1 putative ABC transporter ATP-binding protein [Kibdelosporangium sp. MJ126-NF4]CTQ90280.1 putative ABC transporter ATP-binding protein [Kibdelosporangium sp. MJ126-NF4]
MTTIAANKGVHRADGLGKRYGDTWALWDCAFELKPGQVTALVGANGAGKSTLLSVLSGLVAPDTGTVDISGRVAFVAQDKPLYKNFTAAEMLRLTRHLNKVWDQDRAERWLRTFGVRLDRPCGRLSTGQQAHVALAMAIAARPDLLLLDEPLSNLDPLVRREVTGELLAEVADTEMTLVLSTHVVAELGGVAENLLLLANGKLLLSGETDALLSRYVMHVGPDRTVLVDDDRPPPERWVAHPATLEDIVLAQLASAREAGAA